MKELENGTTCSFCGDFIEMHFLYTAGIPVVLAVLLTIAFQFEYDLVGYLIVAALVIYTSGYSSVFVGYLPLRDYNKRKED